MQGQKFYPFHTSISGSGVVSGDNLHLFVNGKYISTVTANATTFRFQNLSLNVGDTMKIYSKATGSNCYTQSNRFTVSCFTPTAIIRTNATGDLLPGATTITGTTTLASGTVQVYKGTAPSGVAVGSAANVQTDGTWSAAVPALLAGDSYYTIQTVNGCTGSASTAASVRTPASCPTITGSYTTASTQVTGTMPSAFTGTIRLYADGTLIGSVAISSATNWSIPIAANTIYYNAQLRATAQISGGAESNNCSSVAINCTSPLTPAINPSSATIDQGQSVSFTVNNVTANSWYALLDNTGKSYAISQFRTTASGFTLNSQQFSNAGTYSLRLTADALSGCPASFAMSTVTVRSTLPADFLTIVARTKEDGRELKWRVTNEVNVLHYVVERSTDGRNFSDLATIEYKRSNSQVNQYVFVDAQPISFNQVYYRIRQVDEDLKYNYSSIVTTTIIKSDDWYVAPSPATNQFSIHLSSASAARVVVDLIEPNGRVVQTKAVSVEKGSNVISFTNLDLLAKGRYYLRLNNGGRISFRNVVLL